MSLLFSLSWCFYVLSQIPLHSQQPAECSEMSVFCAVPSFYGHCKNDSGSKVQLEMENVGSFMLFASYQAVTFVMPGVCNV
jgi:hypothetical protein